MLKFLRSKVLWEEELTLLSENIDLCSAHLQEMVQTIGMEETKQTELWLSAETVLVHWQEQLSSDAKVRVLLYKILGKYYLELECQGKESDPYAHSTDEGVEAEYTRQLSVALGEGGLHPSFAYAKGKNVVKYSLPRKSLSTNFCNLLAVIGAFLTFAFFTLVSPDIGHYLATTFLKPTADTFIGLFGALAVLLIFTSLPVSICGMGDFSTFSRYSKMVLGRFCWRNAQVVILIGLLYWCCGGIKEINQGTNLSFLGSIYGMLLDVFPSNFLKPLLEGNVTQLVFMGVVLGCLFLTLPKELDLLQKALAQLNFLVTKLLTILCNKVYILIYTSIAQMLLIGMGAQLTLASYVLVALIAVEIIYGCIMFINSCQRNKLAWGLTLKGLSKVWFMGFMTASSFGSLSAIKEFCVDKCRVDGKFFQAIVSLSLIISDSMGCAYFLLASLVPAYMLGVPLTLSQLISACFLAWIMGIAAPKVAGGSIVALMVIFKFINMPETILATFIAMDMLFDMLQTSGNVTIVSMEIINLAREQSASRGLRVEGMCAKRTG